MTFIKSQKGFSLIEILVVIAMVGILSIVVFADFRGHSQNTLFEYTSEDVLGASVQMKEFAKSGKVLSSIDQVPLGGYGMSFSIDPKSIIQFADINDNGIFDEVDKREYIDYISLSPNFEVAKFYLVYDVISPGGIITDSTDHATSSSNPQGKKDKFTVIFKNPNGYMEIVDSSGNRAYSSASLELQNKKTGERIYVNFHKKSGSISVGEKPIEK